MLGLHLMRAFGWIRLSPKPGVAGHVHGGRAGVPAPGSPRWAIALAPSPGPSAGTWTPSRAAWPASSSGPRSSPPYIGLNRTILPWKDFGPITLPELFRVNPWVVVLPVAGLLILLLYWIESAADPDVALIRAAPSILNIPMPPPCATRRVAAAPGGFRGRVGRPRPDGRGAAVGPDSTYLPRTPDCCSRRATSGSRATKSTVNPNPILPPRGCLEEHPLALERSEQLLAPSPF